MTGFYNGKVILEAISSLTSLLELEELSPGVSPVNYHRLGYFRGGGHSTWHFE